MTLCYVYNGESYIANKMFWYSQGPRVRFVCIGEEDVIQWENTLHM